MTDNRSADAPDAFVATLQRAVSCVALGVLVRGRIVQGAPIKLGFPERFVQLRGRHRFKLSILHEFVSGEESTISDKRFASSDGYWYQFHDRNESEVIAFHWHPRQQQAAFPHLHMVGRGAAIEITRASRIPTGRVSFEAVVRFAIEELGVRPLRPDWQQVLNEGIARFDAGRSW